MLRHAIALFAARPGNACRATVPTDGLLVVKEAHVGEKHWSAIITYRQERIRIISVRRSRDQERALYES